MYYSILRVIDAVKGLGVLRGSSFSPSIHWRGAASEAIRQLFTIRRSFAKLSVSTLSPLYYVALWVSVSWVCYVDTDHRISQVTDVRDLGVPLDTTFTASAHCIETAKTAFTPLYCALVRPHLEYVMEANAPTLRADKNQLERVQRLPTRLVRGLRHVPYEERLPHLNLFSLERRRLRTGLILAFKIFKGEIDLNPSDFFLRPPRAGLRGHTYRLLQGPSRLRRRSGAFSVRIVKFWNRLPEHLVLAPSVSIFKKQLDRHWFEIFPAAPV